MTINSDVVFKLYENMTEQKIISAYHGEFNQDVINMLLKQAKWDLNNRKVEIRTLKKTYGILVECLENILKHTSIIHRNNAAKGVSEGIVIFGLNGNQYMVTVGNLVKTDEIKSLKEKIDFVNGLSREELRNEYGNILRHGTLSEKGGAGLGIIDIALKSGKKLGHIFKSYNNDYSFFALQVTIDAGDN